jgi:LysM repeat protein
MGNFEKLSVLVIVVIIVMILVVAIYEWTGSPSEGTAPTEIANVDPLPRPLAVIPDPFPPTPTPPGTPPGPVNPLDTPLDRPLIPDPAPMPPPTPEPAPAPAPAPTPGVTEIPETTHVVVAGDTLGEISMKYYQKASLYTRIMDANPGLTPETLRLGTKLKIPALRIEGTTGPAAPVELASSGDRPIPGKDYKVRRGDTWEKISRAAFNTTERGPEIYVKNMKKVSRRDELRPDLVIAIPN